MTPWGYLIDRFIEVYGYAAFHNPLYPTADHVIPFPLFDARLESIEHLLAARQLQLATGTAHGQALAMGGKERKIQRLTRALERRACPTILRPKSR